MTPKIDLFGSAFKADPHPTYAALRTDEPLHRREGYDGRAAMWFVTRYEEVVAILRDHKRFVKDVRQTLTAEQRAAAPPAPELIELLSNHMLNLDPPNHTRLRGLVNKAFTAAVVQRMEPRIQTIADGLIDKVLRRGQMDLIDDYAFPLPITVIAELLGIPPRDRLRFRNWSHAFVTPSANLQRNRQKFEKTGQIMADFTGYLQQIFAERRAEPREDLISSLIQAEEADDKLSEQELFSMMILLIVAGHETTVNLIGNGLLTLLQHPMQLAQLQADPALLPVAIEELIRFEGPVERATMRFAAEDVELSGCTIHRGDGVSLVLAAADRDPAHFAQPDTLEITRANNRHLGFGLGIHYCLGAPLARLEGQIAIGTLLRRLPNLRLTVPLEKLRWRTVPILRGVQHLPVAWG